MENSGLEDREPLDKGGVASDSFSSGDPVDRFFGGIFPILTGLCDPLGTKYMTLLCRP